MDTPELSVNKVCYVFIIMFLLISGAMAAVLYCLTNDFRVVLCGVSFLVLVFFWAVIFFVFIRSRLRAFSGMLCRRMEHMLAGDAETLYVMEEENLFHKINYHLIRLYEVMQENRRKIAKERGDLQELISDISHQVKTPIANLKVINAILLEEAVPAEKQREFLLACSGQIDKLNFLMQTMIKTSRLETGVISLEKKIQAVDGTIAAALGGILWNAERKEIQVTVDCPENMKVSHDRKWTGEALFNILDNAVKYTTKGGSILICVQKWDMYLKIEITDTGKGIPEKEQGMIFKRFYRGVDTHEMEGIGIGLYLAREIIILQGGYIKVTSEQNKGASFSVYLPYQ